MVDILKANNDNLIENSRNNRNTNNHDHSIKSLLQHNGKSKEY